MKTAVAKEINAVVSLKDSRKLLQKIKGKKVERVKKFLEGLLHILLVYRFLPL